MVSFKEVKNKCISERFFPYDNWRDKIFVPPSILLVWVFINTGASANFVSFLSGVIAIIGSIMMTSENPQMAFFGSFGYILYYLLDYVDGGVARLRGNIGVGGQYIDWLMHVVSSISVFLALFIVVYRIEGNWIITFGILTLISIALNLDKYSFAWFSISMYYQQQQIKTFPDKPKPIKIHQTIKHNQFFYKILKKISVVIYHENYMIFYLPIFSFLNLYISNITLNFSIFIIMAGAILNFPITIIEILKISRNTKIDNSYNNLFFGEERPNLPSDHFLE